jgi:hypothetical protein
MKNYAFIMRVIPGSGKSTVAWSLSADLFRPTYPVDEFAIGIEQRSAIHSTDDLFMVDGKYQFDREVLAERHAQNFWNFKVSLAKGLSPVICDNTNVKVEYYHPYMKAAEDAGYSVVIVEMPHPSPALAACRNSHGVPAEIINQMIMDWEPSQHCVTVAKVEHASRIVEKLQRTSRTIAALAFCSGIVLATVCYSILWAI